VWRPLPHTPHTSLSTPAASPYPLHSLFGSAHPVFVRPRLMNVHTTQIDLSETSFQSGFGAATSKASSARLEVQVAFLSDELRVVEVFPAGSEVRGAAHAGEALAWACT
jgi:hypothetical protein